MLRAWAHRNHRWQKHCRVKDKEALVHNAKKTWAHYPSAKIQRAFENKSLVIDKIIEMNEGKTL